MEPTSQRSDIFSEHLKPIQNKKFIWPKKIRDETFYVDAYLHPSTIKHICRNHIEMDTRVKIFEDFTLEFPSFGLAEKNNVFTLYTIAVAAEKGNTNLIDYLVKKVGKEMLNIGDAKGRTPLYMACKSYVKSESSQSLSGILRLLELGSNPNILCDKRITPLNVAKKSNCNPVLAKYLILYGALE